MVQWSDQFAALAFAFVFIHPFADGNGRIHRYLIHHALAERGFTPEGVVFPVSAVILREIASYRAVLQQRSRQLLPLIEWEPGRDGNVRVLNETADLYRYIDAPPTPSTSSAACRPRWSTTSRRRPPSCRPTTASRPVYSGSSTCPPRP